MKDKITCPVCGGDMKNISTYMDMNFYSCQSQECAMWHCIVSEYDIANRPIETALRSEIATLKARCTWKRALDVMPPLGVLVLALDDFSGATRATFIIENDKLYYSHPRGYMYFPVKENLLWAEMPDMPEEK